MTLLRSVNGYRTATLDNIKNSSQEELNIYPIKREMRFQVLTAASMKMAVFWVVVPCRLVGVYRRFIGSCCLHHQGDKSSPDYKAQQPRRQPSSKRK
jgi:hypothetical protein